MQYLKLISGYRTALADGSMVPNSPQHMATEEIYHAYAGDRISPNNMGYIFAVAIFSLERPAEYIYTYAYQKEANWTTYTQNLTPDSYSKEDYVFEQECYFRVCLKRADGEAITEQDIIQAKGALAFCSDQPQYQEPPYFADEIRDTINKIKQVVHEKKKQNVMKLCLLTDSHYTINGTWEDTAHNILRVAEKIKYDAIVHLGDLTDGMLSKQRTTQVVQKMLKDLDKCGTPVYITPGNHDSNYFRNPGNAFTQKEMKALYRLYDTEVGHDSEGVDYYIDVEEYNVRMIFLSSFDNAAPIRYGYHEYQLEWLKEILASAKYGTKFLIFSHDAPLGKLDYWSFHIRNGEELLDILEEHNAKEGYQIIGFFYGHTHADYVFEECSFPVVSLGCSKLEYFTDKKPKGAIAWEREEHAINQELWDSVLINFEEQKLTMIRFGAGEDREISFAPKKSVYRELAQEKRINRKTKVWAHRGASGRAPENTMPAFHLAQLLGANGIELDVQLTKDGIPVVIHDETVDRVCDGKGWVKDYTLEELKKLNANKQFPAYGRVEIPTLQEVYQWVQNTDLEINLELKNGSIYYEDLEEKVLNLAKQYGLEERIIYSSFNHYSMRKLKCLSPNVRVGFLYSHVLLDMAEYAQKHGADAIHPSIKNIEYSENIDLIKECHAKGIKVHVWTVNEVEDMKKMQHLGVDAVITNYPEKAL